MPTNREDLDEELYKGLSLINGKLWIKGHHEKWKRINLLQKAYEVLGNFEAQEREEAKELINFANELK